MSTTNQQFERPDSSTQLLDQIGNVRKRLFSVGVIAALGWVLLAIIVVLMIAVWFDLLWELPVGARLGSFAVAGGIGILLFAMLGFSLLRKSKQHRLASRLDRVGGTGGEITTGLELSALLESQKNQPSDKPKQQIESGLAELAVDRAAQTAGGIDRSLAVPTKPIKTVALALAGVGLLLAVVGLSMPKLAQTQWARFANPTMTFHRFQRSSLRSLPVILKSSTAKESTLLPN